MLSLPKDANEMMVLGTSFASTLHGKSERSIFQTFWKDDCCAKFLFFKLETSNFGYLLIFKFSLTVQSYRKIGQHLY
jgi:hypothetical protein